MNIPTLTCVMLVLACTVRPMPLSAQTIYRCGNAYSEAPCPGGVAIDVNDRRSAAQKAQTDAAARQAAASALQMERERLALERSVRGPATGNPSAAKARTPPDRVPPPTARHTRPAKKKTAAEPEHFTAAVWADEKKAQQPAGKLPAPPGGKTTGTPVKP